MRIWFALFSPAIVLFTWAAFTVVSANTGNVAGRIALGVALIAHGCAEWKIHRYRRKQKDA